MKLFFIFFHLIILSNATYALNLREIYQEAKINNAAFKTSQINKDILNQQKNQLRAVTLPSVSLEASYIQLEQKKDYDRAGRDDTRETVTFRGRQRLFSGLKDVYTLQSLNSLITEEEFRLRSQELDLLADVSTLYFNILLYQEKAANLRELLSLANDRESMLKKRVTIGKSRRTELRQAKVQTHGYLFDLEQNELLEKNSWNDLETLVGKKLKPEKLSPYINKDQNISPLATYLQKAANHPLVKAQEADIVAMNKEKNSHQAEYFPTIDLTSNYYSQQAESAFNVVPEWDVGLTLTLPIFEGGLTRARVAESALKEARSTTQLKQVKIELESQIKNTYQAILTQQRQQKIIEEMGLDNKSNYIDIKKEYGMGLVTSLEVVTASNTYIESLNLKVENAIDLQLNFIFLKTLIGEDI